MDKHRFLPRLFLLLSLLAWSIAPLSAGVTRASQGQAFVSHEIRYHAAEAGEVAMVWGVDGWQVLPEGLRPAGTAIVTTKAAVMSTPMRAHNGVFSVVVQVPAGSRIDYVFHIIKTRSGVSADVWDVNGIPEQDFATLAQAGGVTDTFQTVSIGSQLFTSPDDSRYQVYGLIAISMLALIAGGIVLRKARRNPYLEF